MDAKSESTAVALVEYFDFTAEPIARIEPAGIEEVFDIQIDRTENFIANGLVSHNTRWHQDDLVGRLLRQAELGGEKWELINFQAIAEEHDELGRSPGEALWPARYDESDLARIRLASTEYYWSALYQQHPSPKSGGLFRDTFFDQLVDASAVPLTWDDLVRFWDKAATATRSGDWTVGVLMGRKGNHLYVLDVVRDKREPFDVEDLIRSLPNAIMTSTATWSRS